MLLKGYDNTISCEEIYNTLSSGLSGDEQHDK